MESTPKSGPVQRTVIPLALDHAGNPVPATCENCEGLFDDSDGPEYGPPWMRCRRKPHMENLRGFPFRTPQRCFEIAWWHLVDWEAEGRKLDEEPDNAALKGRAPGQPDEAT